MTRWMRLQLGAGLSEGRRIVAEAPLRETWKAQVVSAQADENPSGRTGYYGLGWGTASDENGLKLSHSGAFSLGFATVVMLAPDQQLGIAMLSNAEPTGMPEATATTFMNLALKGDPGADWFAIYGNGFAALMQSLYRGPTDYSIPPAHPAKPRPEASYSGSYTNRYYGDIQITEEDSKLLLTNGPRKMRYPLLHWDGDTHVYSPEGENAVTTTGVTFDVGADGKAQSLRIEYLGQHGEGGLTRTASAISN